MESGEFLTTATLSLPAPGGRSDVTARANPLRGYCAALVRLGRFALMAAAVLALGRARLSASLETDLVIAAVAIVSLAIISRSAGDKRVWLVYILGFLLFAQLRKLADETGMAVQFGYPIILDRLLFLGSVPTNLLQDHLHQAGAIRPWDLYLSAVYVSYYFVPHIVAVAIWRFRPQLLSRFVIALLLTFYIGLLASFVAPTAPPWLAAQHGDLGEVTRVFRDMVASVNTTAYSRGEGIVGANDVAAMPSLHFGITALLMIATWRFGRGIAALGLLYTLSMGLALVYLGEHYVSDELAGGATALLAWYLAGRLRGRFAAGALAPILANGPWKRGQTAMLGSPAGDRI